MYGIPQLHRLMIILRYRLDYIIKLFYKYLFAVDNVKTWSSNLLNLAAMDIIGTLDS